MKPIVINKKKMVYDRGRYKTVNNVGSVSAKKGIIQSLFNRKSRLKSEGDRGIGVALSRRAAMIDEIDKEIQKSYK
jgi:hypothetical protein